MSRPLQKRQSPRLATAAKFHRYAYRKLKAITFIKIKEEDYVIYTKV